MRRCRIRIAAISKGMLSNINLLCSLEVRVVTVDVFKAGLSWTLALGRKFRSPPTGLSHRVCQSLDVFTRLAADSDLASGFVIENQVIAR
jgi:hypothetical protein